ncbi:MAG: NAD(P)H-dependent oxidoreductase subunit E [bacterium]
MSTLEASAFDITSVLNAYPGAGRDQLIPILQDVQARLGYLPRAAILSISEHCSLPVSRVYGVATFYNQFRFHPPGRNHIQVCRGTACHVKGSLRILDVIRQKLEIENEQTTQDGEFSLEIVACVGACGLAPVVCINGEIHGGVTQASLSKIIASYRATKGKSRAKVN